MAFSFTLYQHRIFFILILDFVELVSFCDIFDFTTLAAHQRQLLVRFLSLLLSHFWDFFLNNLLLFAYFPLCYGSCYCVSKKTQFVCVCFFFFVFLVCIRMLTHSKAFIFSTANGLFASLISPCSAQIYSIWKIMHFRLCCDARCWICWHSSRRPILSIHWWNYMKIRLSHLFAFVRSLLAVFPSYFILFFSQVKQQYQLYKIQRTHTNTRARTTKEKIEISKKSNQWKLCKTLFRNTEKYKKNHSALTYLKCWFWFYRFVFLFFWFVVFNIKFNIPQLSFVLCFQINFLFQLIPHPK